MSIDPTKEILNANKGVFFYRRVSETEFDMVCPKDRMTVDAASNLAKFTRKEKEPMSKYSEARLYTVECTASLYEAVQSAGGGVGGLLDMTMRDFICQVAAGNFIHFTHDPPEKSSSRLGKGQKRLKCQRPMIGLTQNGK